MNDDERDFPVVTPGQRVLVQLRSQSHWDKDGKLVYQRADVVEMVIRPVEDCYPDPIAEMVNELDHEPHLYTICSDCISDWALDYLITLGDTPAHHGL